MRSGSFHRFFALLILIGCGSSDPDPSPASSASVGEAPSEARTESIDEPLAEPEALEAPPELNLLTTVETILSVSSVYRGHDTEIIRMVDGDPETAWNSDTEDLVGAFINVRVPETATVTGARIVVGFTHQSDEGRDLFSANPRVTRMQVSRNGTVIGEYDLDPSRRDLQPMLFGGAGGDYRFEITGVLEGSNASWREICISEFELLGRSPDAEEGRLPRFSVGELAAAPRPQ